MKHNSIKPKSLVQAALDELGFTHQQMADYMSAKLGSRYHRSGISRWVCGMCRPSVAATAILAPYAARHVLRDILSREPNKDELERIVALICHPRAWS